MASTRNILLFFTLSILIFVPATPQPCNSFRFPNHHNYAACTDLPVLESSLHWSYHASSSTVDVAFKKSNADDSSWIAWGINPTAKGMVGTQALVAMPTSHGAFAAYTLPITSYGTMLQQGNLSFPVHSVSAAYADGHVIIFATLQLPSNSTSVNHVWQHGVVDSNGNPRAHAMSGPNLQSFGTLDLLSGKVSETGSRGGKNSRTTLRNMHGILNAMSWGLLMPGGVILARYLKVFDEIGAAWFQMHRACQTLAYLIGVAGFGTGMYMGNHYGFHHTPHRCIGITLVCLATAQICVAVFLRPKKEHKYRMLWNVFHYVVGYGTIALSIWNVFKGFNILNAYKNWKNIYVAIIISLAAIGLGLEVITWIWVYKKMKAKDSQEQPQP